MSSTHHQVVIAGGGTAGITVAASLRRHAGKAVDIAIVEPSDFHYYQPAWTLVGAGEYGFADTRRREDGLVPSGAKLIKATVQEYDPDNNTVKLSTGDSLTYDYLVVCTGVKLDWDKIDGLAESLGKNGVCSNYMPENSDYTWACVQELQAGATALFTQPPLPFKCPGAPQKAAYLTADHLRRRGILKDCGVRFLLHGPAIFGVPFFAKELVKVADRYGINVEYQHNLVAVDGDNKKAIFEVVGGDKEGEKITLDFHMLHAVPPQSPHDEIKASPLSNDAGWVEVDQGTMRHVRHANVYSLGDVCSTPNSKTAAAVRKQAPVVVKNIIAAIDGEESDAVYDGYASCPLTTARGKAIMAEFIYGGKVTPTLPLDPAKERWANWWIKKTALPIMYWSYMLKGYEWFPGHKTEWRGDAE